MRKTQVRKDSFFLRVILMSTFHVQYGFNATMSVKQRITDGTDSQQIDWNSQSVNLTDDNLLIYVNSYQSI